MPDNRKEKKFFGDLHTDQLVLKSYFADPKNLRGKKKGKNYSKKLPK